MGIHYDKSFNCYTLGIFALATLMNYNFFQCHRGAWAKSEKKQLLQTKISSNQGNFIRNIFRKKLENYLDFVSSGIPKKSRDFMK